MVNVRTLKVVEMILANLRSHGQNQPRINAKTVVNLGNTFGDQLFIKIAGAKKESVIEAIVKKYKPKVVLEFGSLFSWSAHKWLSAMWDAGRSTPSVYCVEIDALNVCFMRAVSALSGCDRWINVLPGHSSDMISHLTRIRKLQHVDVIFMDHRGTLYGRDLELLEAIGRGYMN